MDIIIKDQSGAFESYLKKVYKNDVARYINQKKTMVYLPKDLNSIVRNQLKEKALVRKDVSSIEMKLAKSGAYCFEIVYTKE